MSNYYSLDKEYLEQSYHALITVCLNYFGKAYKRFPEDPRKVDIGWIVLNLSIRKQDVLLLID